MNPYDRLDRFEQKYGEYTELLHLATCGRPDDERRGKELLRTHDRLVWACMGWSDALKAVREGKVQP